MHKYTKRQKQLMTGFKEQWDHSNKTRSIMKIGFRQWGNTKGFYAGEQHVQLLTQDPLWRIHQKEEDWILQNMSAGYCKNVCQECW